MHLEIDLSVSSPSPYANPRVCVLVYSPQVRFCKGIPSVAEAMERGDVVASSVLQRVNGRADARDRLAEDGDGPRLDADGCEVEDCYLLDYCILDD